MAEKAKEKETKAVAHDVLSWISVSGNGIWTG